MSLKFSLIKLFIIMKKNMGNVDRIFRLVVVAVIAYMLFSGQVALGSTLGIVLAVVGAIFLLTSLISSCPLYSIVGLSTCKVKNS